jgi:hypothetical protein
MRELNAKIIISQIRMSVKMDDRKIRMFFYRCPYSPQSDEMFPTQHKWPFTAFKDLGCPLFYCRQSCLGVPEAKLQIPAVESPTVKKIGILIGTV